MSSIGVQGERECDSIMLVGESAQLGLREQRSVRLLVIHNCESV